jgi:hypothetical protein
VKQPAKAKTWRPPTRRAFVAMLAAAASGVALRGKLPIAADRPRSTWTGKTRWIGHC